MFGSVYILYKILIFIFVKGVIIEEYRKFDMLLYNKMIIVMYTLYNKYFFYEENKKNICYCEYNNLNRNSYTDSIYVVKPGDTLFYIAWITGNNYVDLANNNNIKCLEVLKVGQILIVKSDCKYRFCFKKILRKLSLVVCDGYYKIKKIFFFDKKKFYRLINIYFLKCIK